MTHETSFANSEGMVRSFNDLEIDGILTDLNASNSSVTSSYNDLIFIRLADGYILFYDKKPNSNRGLFDMFSFEFSTANPPNVKLVQNDSATEWTLDQALVSVGYTWVVPVASLEQVYMKVYIKSGSYVDVYSKAETHA